MQVLSYDKLAYPLSYNKCIQFYLNGDFHPSDTLVS